MSDDPQPKHTETNGGAFTSGNIAAGGDFIGRDQNVHGDVVKGNKIVIQNTVSSSPLIPPTQPSPRWRRAITINTILIGIFSFLGAIATNIATGILPESWNPYLWLAWPLAVLITGISIWLTLRQSLLEDADSPVPTTVEQRNRQVMLKQVRLDWIDGVLRKSLYQEALISLGLEEQPDAIVRPFDAQVQRPNQKLQPFPVGTKIIDVFDQVGGSLLILGAPGAGKTTLLLELTRDLLDRAEHDEKQLMPVVFNLSSWVVKRQPLAEWLVEELNTKYHIPRKVAQGWVDNEQILPLLDGLDEVAVTYRTACIKSVNDFHHSHNLISLVVCSRIDDYKALRNKLQLLGAVLVKPLARQQADEYLKKLGKPLDGIRAAIKDDPKFGELLETPLWLNIVILTYQDVSPRKLRTTTTMEERRKELVTAYIEAMFIRRGVETRYTQHQVINWLAWIAKKMTQRSQTIFFIDRLQSYWIESEKIRQVNLILTMVVLGLIFRLSGSLIGRLGIGLWAGLLFGIAGIVVGIPSEIRPVEHFNWSFKSGAIWGTLGGIGFGVLGGLIGNLVINSSNGRIIFSIYAIVSGTLFLGLIGGLFNVPSSAELQKLWKGYLVDGLKAGLIFGILIGLIGALKLGLLFGLVWGLGTAFASSLIFGLGPGSNPPFRNMEVRVKTTPNQGIYQSIKSASLFGLSSWLIGGMITWLIFRLLTSVTSETDLLVFSWLDIGLGVGIITALLTGGIPCVKHFILRILLYWNNFSPLNYALFLDYCVDRIFLRRVGGGYIFIHRLVMEHFASLTDEDIARIAGDTQN